VQRDALVALKQAAPKQNPWLKAWAKRKEKPTILKSWRSVRRKKTTAMTAGQSQKANPKIAKKKKSTTEAGEGGWLNGRG